MCHLIKVNQSKLPARDSVVTARNFRALFIITSTMLELKMWLNLKILIKTEPKKRINQNQTEAI